MNDIPVLCIGGACIDYKLKCNSPPINHTSNIVRSSYSYGGVARNIAENLAKWTTNIALQCVVGDDQLGKNLLKHIEQLGIESRHSLSINNYITSHYYAILDQEGDLYFACNDMEIYDNIPFSSFTQSWHQWPDQLIVFLDTNLPKELIDFALELSQCKQLTICIDPVSVTKSAKLPDRLDQVFLIKPNQDEATALSGIPIHTPDDAIKAGHNILNRGVKNVVISLGGQGYVIVNETSETYIPVAPVENIIDVNGAGDSFISGILFGLKQGFDLTKSCEIGHKAASLTLSSHKTAGSVTSVEF